MLKEPIEVTPAQSITAVNLALLVDRPSLLPTGFGKTARHEENYLSPETPRLGVISTTSTTSPIVVKCGCVSLRSLGTCISTFLCRHQSFHKPSGRRLRVVYANQTAIAISVSVLGSNSLPWSKSE